MVCLMWLFAAVAFCRFSYGGVPGDQKWDPREAELSQTNGNYELIDVSFDIESKVLSFHGFENKFELSLTVNEDLVLGNMEHMIEGDKNHPDLKNSYLSTLTESCHYQVYKENNNGKFTGAISICPRKGVRGFIKTEDDTILITPAKRLLDLEYDSNPNKHHEISHKHLIYKMSEFDNKGYEDAIKMEELRRNEKIYHGRGYTGNPDKDRLNKISDIQSSIPRNIVELATQMSDSNSNSNSNINNRRLLANNYCEFLAMADPWWYDTYYSNYGSGYYDDLVSELSNVVNGMSSLFYQTNWGNSVGTIQVKFVAILVMKSFSGDYASLQPSTSGGSTSSSSYLSKLVSWSASSKPDGYSQTFSRSYDAIQIFVGADNFDTGGLAYVGTVCNTNGYNTGLTGIRNGNYMYPTSTITHIATHELGHNFNCDHDQDTTCGNDGGLMGYGDNEDEFSICSVYFVQELFSTKSMSCLQDGVRSFEDDPDENGGGSGDDDDNDDDDDDDDDDNNGGNDCIRVYNLDSVNGYSFNTVFSYGGSYNNQPYYYASISGKTFYMYYSGNWGGYHIYDSFAWSDGDAWVSGTDPTSGTWYTNGGSWSTDSNAYATSECSGSGGGGDDDDDDDDDSDCSGYNCVGVWNLDLSHYNGGYSLYSCHNGEAVYSKSGYYLYFNTHWNEWALYSSIIDDWVDTGCGESNVMDCGGSWWVYNNNQWYIDSNSYMYTCSGYDSGRDGSDDSDSGTIIGTDFTLSNNCTNIYGSNVCIYNDGTLWDGNKNDGVATFKYEGCYNNVPFFQYTSYPSTSNDSIITYYLHFDNVNNDWRISTGSAESMDGLAVCNKTDLIMCTYSEWTVQTNYGDSIKFELSDSMGYDSVCIVTDDDLAYCQNDGSCALWQFKLKIDDSKYSFKICDESYIQCLDGNLISDYTQSINSMYVCESDFEVYVYYNVSFVSTSGYDVYSDYSENYVSNVANCFGNPQDSSELTVEMVYSHLKQCDNCQNFVPSEESAAFVKAPGVFLMALSLAFTLFRA